MIKVQDLHRNNIYTLHYFYIKQKEVSTDKKLIFRVKRSNFTKKNKKIRKHIETLKISRRSP